jgi:hypothetical protein
MNYLLPVLGVLAGLISLAAYPPYIKDMVHGSTRPARASWLIWLTLSGIALGSQISAHGRWSLVMTIAQTIGAALIFIFSIKYGSGGLRRRDIFSLVAAAAGLVLWLVTDEPILALIFVIVVDAAGAWLTVYKSYKDPGSETLITWWLDSISNLFGLLAVGSLNITLLSYPAYLLLANGAVVIAIYAGRRKLSP